MRSTRDPVGAGSGARITLVALCLAVLVPKAARRLDAGGVAAPGPGTLTPDVLVVAGVWTALFVLAWSLGGAPARARRAGGAQAGAALLGVLIAPIVAGTVGDLVLASAGVTGAPSRSPVQLVLNWAITTLSLLVPYTTAYTVLRPDVGRTVRAAALRHVAAFATSLVGYQLLILARHRLPSGGLLFVVLAAGAVAWGVWYERRGTRRIFVG